VSIVDRLKQRLLHADSVVNLMTGLGGSADKGAQVAVDTTERRFTQSEKDALARNDGYIVSWFERTANEATLTGWDLKVGAEYLRTFEEKDRVLKIRAALAQGLKDAFRDGGALALLAVDDGESDWSKPLDLSRVTAVTAVHVFDGSEFEAALYETDVRNPNWRGVSHWQLSPQIPMDPSRPLAAANASSNLRRVHHTRCIYIPGRTLSARIRYLLGGKDDPYLTAVWDGLKDMRQIDQGAAVLAQEMKESVIKVGGLEGVDASTMADALMSRLRTIAAGKGQLGMIVLGDEDEYSSRAMSATGYKDLKGGARSTWAAYTGQPETVAFGATPGGLNTDGEAGRKAQDRMITAIQKTHILPFLERYYEVLVAAHENAGEDVPDDYAVVFRPLGTLTRAEDAQVRYNIAMADRIYIQMGVYPAEHVASGRFGPNGYQYDLPPYEAVEDADAADPSRALAGPQGRTLLEYVLQVAVKAIPRDTGIAMIMHAFQYTPEEAELIMGDVGRTFFVDPAVVGAQPDAKTGTKQIQGGKSDEEDTLLPPDPTNLLDEEEGTL
jgi:phage-related protein (TIGR01555 family)